MFIASRGTRAKIVGQKAPFKIQDIWALRVRLQMEGMTRDLALFNVGIDSKLRGCDLVALRVRDIPGSVRHIFQMWRTKATLIYRRAKNLRAVQLVLRHSKLESTVRSSASK